MPKVYAVRRGKRTGIFNTWDEAKAQVEGFSNAEFKSFRSEAEAQAWLEEKNGTVPQKEAHMRIGPEKREATFRGKAIKLESETTPMSASISPSTVLGQMRWDPRDGSIFLSLKPIDNAS
ncbi:uncharacterized protein CTHT_0021530 [Thermochaetoides thermophila DSM 1495]|uniref:ribonuclease H n=1 Tax=Chaetomium thermophilum (strain DSM 1495 / CBS 144.50 / IMI 039719) TaxID=759272 RepID=G0S3K0_CHATD|nr:hypothetical protein CTHT_0021530 [Thermochaetoides thermophila DSM 1495]EGS20327.1 hypothetical protein CTHT_0021530 [Thermochaetoides thermophila DSM 1495]